MFAKQVIYTLKQRYGSIITVVRLDSQEKDYQGGIVTPSYSLYTVPKAIELPNELKSQFSYDIAYVKAASNFTQGGFYDIRQRFFIFDKDDLEVLESAPLRLNDYIIKQRIKIRIAKIELIEDQILYVVGHELTQEETATFPISFSESVGLGGEVDAS
jgi:hypothetical protein